MPAPALPDDSDDATALLRQAAAFMGVCVGRQRAANQSEVVRSLALGSRLRLVIEADADNILAAHVDLISADGAIVVLTALELEWTKMGDRDD